MYYSYVCASSASSVCMCVRVCVCVYVFQSRNTNYSPQTLINQRSINNQHKRTSSGYVKCYVLGPSSAIPPYYLSLLSLCSLHAYVMVLFPSYVYVMALFLSYAYIMVLCVLVLWNSRYVVFSHAVLAVAFIHY